MREPDKRDKTIKAHTFTLSAFFRALGSIVFVMEYLKAKEEIIEAISEKLRSERTAKTVELYLEFYIGKCANIEDRKLEHFNGEVFGVAKMPDSIYFNEMYELASGSPDKISGLEEELISYFLNSEWENKCKNKTTESAGNNQADSLYVLFHMEIEKSEIAEQFAVHTIHNDQSPIKDGFPLIIE